MRPRAPARPGTAPPMKCNLPAHIAQPTRSLADPRRAAASRALQTFPERSPPQLRWRIRCHGEIACERQINFLLIVTWAASEAVGCGPSSEPRWPMALLRLLTFSFKDAFLSFTHFSSGDYFSCIRDRRAPVILLSNRESSLSPTQSFESFDHFILLWPASKTLVPKAFLKTGSHV